MDQVVKPMVEAENLTWRDKIMKRCNLSYFRKMIR